MLNGAGDNGMNENKNQVNTFQGLIAALQDFGASKVVSLCSHWTLEVGAGTFHAGSF